MLFLAIILADAGISFALMGIMFGAIFIFGSQAKKNLVKQFIALINHFGPDMEANLETPKKASPSINGTLFGRDFRLWMTKETSGDSTVNYTHFSLGYKANQVKMVLLRKERKVDRLQKRMGTIVEHEIGWPPFDKLYLLKTTDGQFLDQVFDDELVDLFITAYPHLRGTFEIIGTELIYKEIMAINTHKKRLRYQKIIELGLFMADRLEWALND
ncbi:MAG: hypothetical protein AAFV80_20915 [Bacteroidota bacterium]